MNKEQVRNRIDEVYKVFPVESACEYVDKFYAVILEAFNNERYNLGKIKKFIKFTV